MQHPPRAGLTATLSLGLGVTALGLGALNFNDPTPPAKLEHHRAWAVARGLPAPSPGFRRRAFLATGLGIATSLAAAGAGLLARDRKATTHDR